MRMETDVPTFVMDADLLCGRMYQDLQCKGPEGKEPEVRLSSAKSILLNSQTCHPATVLAAVNYLAKIGQVGNKGQLGVAGMLPDALYTYVAEPNLSEFHVPLALVKRTVVLWAQEQLTLSTLKGLSKKEETMLFALMTPVIEALNLCALASCNQPLCLVSKQDLIETKTHLLMTELSPCHVQPKWQSLWDCRSSNAIVKLQSPSVVSVGKCEGHSMVKSRLCLSSGSWVFSIRVHKLGNDHACIGLADMTGDVYGTKKGDSSLMLSTRGVLRMTTQGRTCKQVLCLPAKRQADHQTINVHLDMAARTCGFSLNGKFLGISFRDIPQFVSPAVYLPKRSTAEFLYIDSSRDIELA